MLRPGGGYVGWQGQGREALQSDDRMQLVGLEAVSEMIPEGAMLLSASTAPPVGHVTSAGRRVLGSGAVALGLLRAGRSQHGAELIATSPTRGQNVRVRVVPPIFHDKDGEAYRD